MSEEERYLTLFEKQFEIRDELLKAKKRFENNTTDNRINYFKYYFLFFVYGSHLIFSLFFRPDILFYYVKLSPFTVYVFDIFVITTFIFFFRFVGFMFEEPLSKNKFFIKFKKSLKIKKMKNNKKYKRSELRNNSEVKRYFKKEDNLQDELKKIHKELEKIDISKFDTEHLQEIALNMVLNNEIKYSKNEILKNLDIDDLDIKDINSILEKEKP